MSREQHIKSAAKTSGGKTFLLSAKTLADLQQRDMPVEMDPQQFDWRELDGRRIYRLREKRGEDPSGVAVGGLKLPWQTVIYRVKSDVQGAQVAVVRGVLRDEGGVAIEVEGFVDAEGVEIGHDIAPTLVDAAYAWLELDFDSNGEVTLATIKAGDKWEGYPQAFTFDTAEPYRQTKYRKLLATIKMEAAVAPATEARMVLELEHVGGNLQLVMGYVYGRLVRMAINS